MNRTLCLFATLALSSSALSLPVRSDTLTLGRLNESITGNPFVGAEVGMVRESVVRTTPPGTSVVPDQMTLTWMDGTYAFYIDPTDPSYEEFYVFSMASAGYNQIFGGVDSTLPRPFPEDFRELGVVVLDGRVDNSNIDFVLDSNRTTEMVLMSDGVTHLATEIWRVSRLIEAPTILERTPYAREGAWARDFVSFGYNAVGQDVRGRFDSEGRYEPFRDDGWGPNRDGYDCIEWIAAQPWSDGQIGMTGASAGGMTQYLAAGAAPPSLKCCIPAFATGDFYDLWFTGGIFRKAMCDYWLEFQGIPEYVSEFEAHPNRDSWWDANDLSTRYSHVRVPFLHLTGWFDIMQDHGTRAFAGFQYQGADGARGRQKMVIGPWSHGAPYQRHQGEVLFPPNAKWKWDETMQLKADFFDYWMKGADNGFYDTPPVLYYQMGDVDVSGPWNQWRSADDWPPPSEPVALYLGTNGTLGEARPPTSGSGRISYTYDPRNPALNRGGSNLHLVQGPMDQSPLEARHDVLAFTTEPLTEPLEVTGELAVELYVSSLARDTDFIVRLCDVYPDGRSLMMQEGAIKGRHWQSDRYETLLEPGRIYRLEIDLWGTSIVFNQGHRIRVDVTSSATPRWEPNPNTGEPFRQHTRLLNARNTIHCGGETPSRILLPVVR